MWCVADLNEDYITKMEDVLGIYERPYDSQHPVVCSDEKPVTLHAEVRPASPAVPGGEQAGPKMNLVPRNSIEICKRSTGFGVDYSLAARSSATPQEVSPRVLHVRFHLAIGLGAIPCTFPRKAC
jgi:hypothetical protein